MPDIDAMPAADDLPHGFELEQADVYSKYLLHSRVEILSILRLLIHKGAMITVHFDQGQSFLLTSMLALSPDLRSFILDIGSNEEMNARALRADRLILTTVLDKVKIQFSLSRLTSAVHEGRAAFIGELPASLLRLQRREYFRIETPRVNPLILFARMPDGQLLKLAAHDISVSGIGLDAPELPAGIEIGIELPNCHFALPGESRELFFSAIVRNYFQYTSRSGAVFWRIGLQFKDLPLGDENRIQRYITQIERGRHELG